MKAKNMNTKIFLDGGDPNETKEIINLLGFLDGQTTNPTLISKNPEAQKRLERGLKFREKEIYDFYKSVVQEISRLIPKGSISVEVYADQQTTTDQMLKQAREMFSWIPNAHIKFPTTKAGLAAAEQSIKEGLQVNMTLCFTQEQAAAVYAATKGAKKGQGFVSPFIGRLDDRGENGMDLIANILKMYRQGDGHVEVLTASVRHLDHFLQALKLGSDIITAPAKILKEWTQNGKSVPVSTYAYNSGDLKPIPYQEIDLTKPWQQFNIAHELTDAGIKRFSDDWNALIK
jgi:transaldolase